MGAFATLPTSPCYLTRILHGIAVLRVLVANFATILKTTRLEAG